MPRQPIHIGILTFSDGRDYIHEEMPAVNVGFQDGLIKAAEATGEVTVTAGERIINTAEVARSEGWRRPEWNSPSATMPSGPTPTSPPSRSASPRDEEARIACVFIKKVLSGGAS